MAARARTALVVATTFLCATFGSPGAGVAAPCKVVRGRASDGAWSRIPLPAFEHGPFRSARRDPGSYGYAVTRRRIFVKDSWSILESRDGGCTWEPTFEVSRDVSPPDAEAGAVRIVSLTAASTAPGGGTAYALVDDAGAPVIATRDEGAAGWSVSAMAAEPLGVPVTGHAFEMWVSADGRTLYVLVAVAGYGKPRSGVAPELALYGSDDGGRSWSQRHVFISPRPWQENPPRVASTGDATCPAGPDRCVFAAPWVMALDPIDAKTLWTSNDTGIFRSLDGGFTWRNVYPVSGLGEMNGIVVEHYARGHARVAAFGRFKAARSDDGGGTWELVDPPWGIDANGQQRPQSTLDSVAVGRGQILVARDPSESFAGTNVQLLRKGGGWAAVAPPMLTCPTNDEGVSPDWECVTQLSYAPGKHSFFGITGGGTDLMSFRPSRP